MNYKHFKLSILPALVIALLAGACMPQSVVTEPSVIEVGEELINLPQEAGEKTIDVKSNEEQLVAVSNRDWLTAVPQEGSVKIIYDANKEITSRGAIIMIQAGDATKQIKVEQKGSPFYVETAPETIVLDPWEHETVISVRLNGTNWSVSSSEEWLTVSALPWKNEVKLKVTNNRSTDSDESSVRSADLLFQVDGMPATATITVSQKEWPLFMLPFIDFEFGTKSIVTAFELERKSMVAQITGAKFIDFNTISPLISRMNYTFSTRGVMEYAQMDIAEPYKTYDEEGNEVMNDKAYNLIIKGLTQNGFTEKRSDNEYFNPDKRVLAEVKRKYSFNPHVLYSHIPKQKEKYPTFEAFPYPGIPFGATYDKVKEYEEQNGGVYDAKSSEYSEEKNICFIAYKVPHSKAVKYRNYYFTYTDGKPQQFIGALQEWYDFNLVYYENNGHFYITEEFAALMEKEGFKYNGKSDDENSFDIYENSSKGILIKIKFAHFSGEDDPSLVILMMPSHSGQNSAMQLYTPLTKKLRANVGRSAK